MRAGAGLLVGSHDFRAYTEELQPEIENTVRKLHSVEVRKVGDEYWIDVKGTAFLRGMMRRMSGVLYEVGRGIRPVHQVGALLTEKREEMHWPVVLPAAGLTLMGITYGRHPKDVRKTASENDLD
jgi:tRNA pseudouridine38-40 synthase